MNQWPNHQVETPPSVSVTELTGDWGQFSCLPRCAVGSGRSPDVGQRTHLDDVHHRW